MYSYYLNLEVKTMANINIISLFISVIVSTIIGMTWYSPALFGKHWMKMMGFNKKKIDSMKKNMTGTYLAIFVATLVQAYVLANLIVVHGPKTINDGMTVGFFAWLGFVAVTQLGTILWSDKPISLFFINAGNSFVSMMAMAGILTYFIL